MNEYERAREAIDHLIVMAVSKYELNNTEFYADAILALPMICVKADEQGLKTDAQWFDDWGGESGKAGYNLAVKDMIMQGFVRIAKREE